MIAVFVTVIVVLAAQALRSLLGRSGSQPIVLGAIGSLRVVPGQLWMPRIWGVSRQGTIWALWLIAAVVSVSVFYDTPSSQVFLGLLLGGSLSNTIEFSLRDGISDYVCLRFWPAFNFADLALVAGAICSVAESLLRHGVGW
jgi:signal peptidase II